MSLSDFENSNDVEEPKRKKFKRRGCLANCCNMARNTQIVSQDKLYNYLADQSTILGDSTIFAVCNSGPMSHKHSTKFGAEVEDGDSHLLEGH